MAYCVADDLEIGDIDLPRGVTAESAIEKAAREMDIKLGRVYKLPLNVSPEAAADVALLVKINSFLASGRVILRAASGGEDNNLHTYGYYLVRDADNALNAILEGKLALQFQEPAPGTLQDHPSGPEIFNADEEGFVNSFYKFKGTIHGGAST